MLKARAVENFNDTEKNLLRRGRGTTRSDWLHSAGLRPAVDPKRKPLRQHRTIPPNHPPFADDTGQGLKVAKAEFIGWPPPSSASRASGPPRATTRSATSEGAVEIWSGRLSATGLIRQPVCPWPPAPALRSSRWRCTFRCSCNPRAPTAGGRTRCPIPCRQVPLASAK